MYKNLSECNYILRWKKKYKNVFGWLVGDVLGRLG